MAKKSKKAVLVSPNDRMMRPEDTQRSDKRLRSRLYYFEDIDTHIRAESQARAEQLAQEIRNQAAK